MPRPLGDSLHPGHMIVTGVEVVRPEGRGLGGSRQEHESHTWEAKIRRYDIGLFMEFVISFANFSIRTFQPHRAIYTAAVRTGAKFQIASIHKSEDREV